MLFRVLCYTNRTQAAPSRLLSQVPGLEPPGWIRSTWPSDTNNLRLQADFLDGDF